jgi:formate-dependent nitrite reductase cytochrome c552 subunit
MTCTSLGLLMSAALALVCAGCTEGGRARELQVSATDTAHSDTLPARALAAALQAGAPRPAEAEPVQGFSGPGGRPFEVAVRTSERDAGHPRRFGTLTLPTAMRTREVEDHPCASCHLDRKVVMAEKRAADAHQDIQPVHPKATGSRCATCHASENVELLALKSGERATFDESYRLCGQCHFQQAEAWSAGAHGKRLDGWAGERVVMGCADCHDPHKPDFEPRVPFRAPHIERIRSADQ